MVAGRGAGEQVVGQAQRVEVLDDDPVVFGGGLGRGQALGVGLHQDRGAVLVGARDHQHVVTAHAHVAGEDVGGNPETCYMSDVARTVGVRPGQRGQYVSHGTNANGPESGTTSAYSLYRAKFAHRHSEYSPIARRGTVPMVKYPYVQNTPRRRHRERPRSAPGRAAEPIGYQAEGMDAIRAVWERAGDTERRHRDRAPAPPRRRRPRGLAAS
ncbi:hypothetical protein GCM10029992_22960 [Glycomyces albus]